MQSMCQVSACALCSCFHRTHCTWVSACPVPIPSWEKQAPTKQVSTWKDECKETSDPSHVETGGADLRPSLCQSIQMLSTSWNIEERCSEQLKWLERLHLKHGFSTTFANAHPPLNAHCISRVRWRYGQWAPTDSDCRFSMMHFMWHAAAKLSASSNFTKFYG